ncbi:hypothetical protein NUW54_g9239 [Trametes sanguinea]|uniref:Uncharacterized protein n=1 Tax=Trametes sanguinea TaxID=158606 RepID=A0ACC1P7I8_9APHY|nr:hypothetical protein NUW54_g9239 [Trametes sanguinea]
MFSQPSSPILKARRQRRRLYSKVLCVVLGILSTIWFIRIAYLEQGSQLSDARGLSSYNTGGTFICIPTGGRSESSATINIPTLAAIVPITPRSLLDLEATLCALLRSPGPLTEVILLTPRQHHSSTRRVVQSILSMDENVDTEMCLRIWPPSMEEGHAVLRAARDATTDWVLLLDEDGLANLSATILDKLLLRTRPTVVAPVGVRGLDYYLDGVTCVSSPGSSAAFLVPPMVLPTAAIPPYIAAVSETDVWSTVGKSLSRSGFNVSGGLGTGTIPSDNPRRQDWCSRYVPKGPDGSPVPVYGLVTSAAAQSDDAATATAETIRQVEGASKGSFLFSARSEDLRYLFPLACRLLANGHSASVLVQDMAENLLRAPCNVSVLSSLVSPSTVNTGRSFSQALLASGVFKNADIVISTLVSKNLLSEFPHAVMVHIPPEDLPYIDWMTAIGLEEWKRWHVPEIQLSVITNDRPESLSRLLNSLTNARYFGDKLTLRINVEQTADPETLRMVDAYSWAHGAVVLHHRVTHGGLLTAVVESWYPHGNDSYALILEDDVELSPLFYAYMKLSLLRYRYGKPENRSPHLFGISLYQQKNLELRPEGRHPFNARSVFEDAGLPEPTSPYLSQIACSWGALDRLAASPDGRPGRAIEQVDAVVEEVLHRARLPPGIRDALPELRRLRVPVDQPP